MTVPEHVVLQVALALPLGRTPPGYRTEVYLDNGTTQTMIVSVFGVRLEAMPDGAPVTVDLLMAMDDMGEPVVILGNIPGHTASQLNGPRKWFRAELTELREQD